jgi:D-xylose transport system substrate-binding protein
MRTKFNIILYFFWVFILFILINSCSQDKSIKIGFLFNNMKAERYKKEQVFFTDKLKQLGGEAMVLSADYDEALQMKQAEDLIKQGIKVLVLNAVNFNTAGAIVRLAHKNDIKVIAYDRLISNCDLDYFVSFNMEKVGQYMAEYVTKLKPKGKYIILGGDLVDKNAIFINKGQMQVLDPIIKSGKIKILYHIFIEKWSEAGAQYETRRFLNLSNEIPDVIVASNSTLALGAVKALKEFKLEGKVLITGQDADLINCVNIVKGQQTMTVFKRYILEAHKAAELAMMIAKGENNSETFIPFPNGYKDVPSILFDPIVVDINNLKTTVIADGIQKESDIYKE